MIGHHDSLKSGTRATMREPIIGFDPQQASKLEAARSEFQRTRGGVQMDGLNCKTCRGSFSRMQQFQRWHCRDQIFLQGQALRTFYVLKPDIVKHAATFGCKLCSFVSRGAKSSVRHSDEAGRESWMKEECGRSWTRML